MISQDNLKKIKEIVEEFFKKMTIEVEVEFLPPKETFSQGEQEEKIYTLPMNLNTKEPQILIGERGQTLSEIQHLLKIILKRTLRQAQGESLRQAQGESLRQAQGEKAKEEPFFIDLDISDYKKKKSEYLKEMARSLADEVALSKKEQWLPPMPAYERRIIHLEIAERKDVTTESIGQEPERKVVVRPYP